jgi:hypothetical protein
MEKIYVTKTVKFEKSADELDFDNMDQFGWKDHDQHDFVEINNDMLSTDAEPIEIDRLIAILNEAKSKGSTHVAVEYHCDHIGYDIAGIEMRLSTQEEIDSFENKRKAAQDKRRQIHDLQAKIARLQNEQ